MISPRYRWRFRTPTLHVPMSVDDVVPFLLDVRGIPRTEQPAFLTPSYEDTLHDPSALPDFPAALERVLRARDRGEEVAIFGDYDVDGVTASAVLLQTFRLLSIRAHATVPHRETDGYGLTVSAVRALVPPATLLITVDNGTSASEAVAEARRRGADVVILDHHAVQGELPRDALIVNPARPDHGYPFSRLSAVGLAFKLSRALLHRFGRDGEAKWLLDLVALGTLADRVPLTGENRTLVQWGLRVLREGPRIGLHALAAAARVHLPSCDAHAVSFRLIPRLNAAGRMRHADLALTLLTTRDPVEASALAATLEEINAERRALTDRVAKDIEETLVRSVPLPDMLCVSGPWPLGVLGILAGRLAEDVGRPAVVIGVGETTCTASVRGNGTVNVVDIVAGLSEVLTKFGGHAEAAGFSFPREALPEVEQYFAKLTLSEGREDSPALLIDCAFPSAAVTSDLARQLTVLEPHGEGNERPVFLFEELRVEDVRSIGGHGEHHRFWVSHSSRPGETLSAVAFRWNRRPLPVRGDAIDVAAEVRIDRFRGKERVDLHLRDVQTHGVHPHTVNSVSNFEQVTGLAGPGLASTSEGKGGSMGGGKP